MSALLKSRLSAAAPKLTRTFVARPKHAIKDPLLTASNAEVTELPGSLTFVHRPPPTAETPLSYTTNPSSPLLRAASSTQAAASSSSALPPALHPAQPTPNAGKRLTQAQIDEIRQRRAKDPKSNPAWKLAEEYGCSRLFVSMIAPIRKIDVKTADGLVQMTEAQRRQLEREGAMAKWGERKTVNKEVRRLREAMW